jgi:citrate synthase
VTPSVFDPGLSSTAVAETGLAEIDSDAGELHIQGFSVEDLAENASYEEAVWLLLNGRLPTDDELTEFTDELSTARSLTDDMHRLIQAGAEEAVPAIDVLRASLGAESLSSDSEDALLATRRVVATCPTIIATYWRYHQGLEPVQPRQDLDHTENFLYMLTGAEPDELAIEGLETYLMTMIEHGLNPSTFAARIIGSTGSDPLSAATGAIGALKGPRHGGAVEQVFEMFTAADQEADPTEYVETRLEDDGMLAGFGHSVYTTRDPRATILKQMAERVFDDRNSTLVLHNAQQIEAAAEKYLAEHHPERQMHVNVDYYAAVLLDGLNIPSELFTAVFAIGRSAGWMAHYLEQFESNTLLRPRTRYIGPEKRAWVSRSDRSIVGGSSPPSASALDSISSTLGALSEPARLELLLILYESPEPLSYSSIRTQSSIEDKGRFNYHLRKLRGVFITNTEAGYSLTETGSKIVDMLLDDEQLLTQILE